MLYRAAKADPGRRFHALMDKVYRRDVLARAWVRVRANNGAPGIDKTTLDQIEEYGVARLLDELAAELREGRYRPLPARRVLIPKPGVREEYRPLSIPAVRDRIVQAAVKIVFEPVFEADMLDCSFGFRPRRSAHDALQVLVDEQAKGRRWVVETDIADCFSAIPHQELMRAIEERICDRSLLKLLRQILRAGVMAEGQVRREVTGSPQGGVVSPVLCNVYLHRLDRAWDEADGRLVRYADDLIAMCWSRGQAERALARLTRLLAELGLEPKAAKTRIVHLEVGGEGLDFLGFHHRLVRSRGLNGKRPFVFLARWPADKAMQHARDRIREITARRRMLLWPEAIVQDLNGFLRGWAGYFRYGHSARCLSKIRRYAQIRLAHFIRRRHRRSMAFGWWVLTRSQPVDLGLIGLYGIVVAPRAGKPWRDRPNAGGERRR
ncbi:group II intron reverse transcriptase/maturase [Spongiactinospora sp. TRM90649]|uniref:group II intron reverse transcriptase/maturase n=1 Tax=Spongiactinospora sp. TRM90649 TaxID=3031114 RepID=UPI0023F7874B|nr:group II intron reverse transcriptase/maturase [Spongiactinospora sp. TRM90649]MDF5759404.1 group II intron reverse transcriptase/maturase [Spongiactinospora sp. TRM90649]